MSGVKKKKNVEKTDYSQQNPGVLIAETNTDLWS